MNVAKIKLVSKDLASIFLKGLLKLILMFLGLGFFLAMIWVIGTSLLYGPEWARWSVISIFVLLFIMVLGVEDRR